MRLRASFLPALMAVALARPAAADVQVQVTGGTVEITAAAAPVAEVLDRLARQTGMKIVYEGAAPRQLVSLSIKDRTPAQAVLAVLEGQGVNFALVTDATGANVRTLLVTGSAPASSGPAPTRVVSSPARAFPPPAASPEPLGAEEDEEPSDEPPAFGVPSGVEGTEAPPPTPPEGALQAPGAARAPVTPAPAMPTAPVQQFPVSPFAPRMTAPVPAPAPATPPPQ
jgi:hypothetical protein